MSFFIIETTHGFPCDQVIEVYEAGTLEEAQEEAIEILMQEISAYDKTQGLLFDTEEQADEWLYDNGLA